MEPPFLGLLWPWFYLVLLSCCCLSRALWRAIWTERGSFLQARTCWQHPHCPLPAPGGGGWTTSSCGFLFFVWDQPQTQGSHPFTPYPISVKKHRHLLVSSSSSHVHSCTGSSLFCRDVLRPEADSQRHRTLQLQAPSWQDLVPCVSGSLHNFLFFSWSSRLSCKHWPPNLDVPLLKGAFKGCRQKLTSGLAPFQPGTWGLCDQPLKMVLAHPPLVPAGADVREAGNGNSFLQNLWKEARESAFIKAHPMQIYPNLDWIAVTAWIGIKLCNLCYACFLKIRILYFINKFTLKRVACWSQVHTSEIHQSA